MKEIVTLKNMIINNQITMVSEERFDMIIEHKEHIEKIDGDVVECGVWLGGMSIFLSKIFHDKNIWVCDSYEGIEDRQTSTYYYERERHGAGSYAIDLETVRHNFKMFDALDEPRIQFLKGFVKDTLNLETCRIKQISLLRIDVDAFSATLDVLYGLYDKVSIGGYIIFDDSCLQEAHAAIRHFFKEKGHTHLYEPITNKKLNVFETDLGKLPCGCFIIKEI